MTETSTDSRKEDELAVHSPFNNVISLFNNEGSSPDLVFIIPGLDQSLDLHQNVLGLASSTVLSCSKVDPDLLSQCSLLKTNAMHTRELNLQSYPNTDSKQMMN